MGPRGEITYAQHPAPDAVRVEKIEIETLSPERRRAINRLLREERSADRRSGRHGEAEDKWARVDREIRYAQAQLQRAEGILEKGRTPRPGERLGIVGGGSRLTEAYFGRVDKLELAVEQAKHRLDRAYDARNELRESASVFATCSPPTRATRPRPSPDDHKESRSKNAMGDGPRGGSPFLVGITEYQCAAKSKSSLIDGSLAL